MGDNEFILPKKNSSDASDMSDTQSVPLYLLFQPRMSPENGLRHWELERWRWFFKWINLR